MSLSRNTAVTEPDMANGITRNSVVDAQALAVQQVYRKYSINDVPSSP